MSSVNKFGVLQYNDSFYRNAVHSQAKNQSSITETAAMRDTKKIKGGNPNARHSNRNSNKNTCDKKSLSHVIYVPYMQHLPNEDQSRLYRVYGHSPITGRNSTKVSPISSHTTQYRQISDDIDAEQNSADDRWDNSAQQRNGHIPLFGHREVYQRHDNDNGHERTHNSPSCSDQDGYKLEDSSNCQWDVDGAISKMDVIGVSPEEGCDDSESSTDRIIRTVTTGDGDWGNTPWCVREAVLKVIWDHKHTEEQRSPMEAVSLHLQHSRTRYTRSKRVYHDPYENSSYPCHNKHGVTGNRPHGDIIVVPPPFYNGSVHKINSDSMVESPRSNVSVSFISRGQNTECDTFLQSMTMKEGNKSKCGQKKTIENGSDYSGLLRDDMTLITTFGEAEKYRHKSVKNMTHIHRNLSAIHKEVHQYVRHQVKAATEVDPFLMTRLKRAGELKKQGKTLPPLHTIVPQSLRLKQAVDVQRFQEFEESLKQTVELSHNFMYFWLTDDEARGTRFTAPISASTVVVTHEGQQKVGGENIIEYEDEFVKMMDDWMNRCSQETNVDNDEGKLDNVKQIEAKGTPGEKMIQISSEKYSYIDVSRGSSPNPSREECPVEKKKERGDEEKKITFPTPPRPKLSKGKGKEKATAPKSHSSSTSRSKSARCSKNDVILCNNRHDNSSNVIGLAVKERLIATQQPVTQKDSQSMPVADNCTVEAKDGVHQDNLPKLSSSSSSVLLCNTPSNDRIISRLGDTRNNDRNDGNDGIGSEVIDISPSSSVSNESEVVNSTKYPSSMMAKVSQKGSESVGYPVTAAISGVLRSVEEIKPPGQGICGASSDVALQDFHEYEGPLTRSINQNKILFDSSSNLVSVNNIISSTTSKNYKDPLDATAQGGEDLHPSTPVLMSTINKPGGSISSKSDILPSIGRLQTSQRETLEAGHIPSPQGVSRSDIGPSTLSVTAPLHQQSLSSIDDTTPCVEACANSYMKGIQDVDKGVTPEVTWDNAVTPQSAMPDSKATSRMITIGNRRIDLNAYIAKDSDDSSSDS